MNIILLSGGSGKRLWPLSNDIRSKQFIKIFKTGQPLNFVIRYFQNMAMFHTIQNFSFCIGKGSPERLS